MSFRIHFFTDCLRCLSIVVNLFRSRFPGVFSSPEKAKRRTHPTNRRQSFRGESFSLVETPSTSVSRTTICYSVLTFPGGWALENSTTIRGLRRGVGGQARALARSRCDDTCFSTSRVLRSLWLSSRSRSPIELRHLPRPRTKTSEARMQTGRARTTLPLRPSPSDPPALRRLRLRPGPRCNRT